MSNPEIKLSARITVPCRLPGQLPNTSAVLVDKNDLLGGPLKDTRSDVLYCTNTTCTLRPKEDEEYPPRIATLEKDYPSVASCIDVPEIPQNLFNRDISSSQLNPDAHGRLPA